MDSPADQVPVDLPVDRSATNAADQVTLPVTATEEVLAVDSVVVSPVDLSLPAPVRPSTRTELPSSASESAIYSQVGQGGMREGDETTSERERGLVLTISRCNGENHLARDCLLPRDEAAINASKKCYKCQETGHIARYVAVSLSLSS